MKTTSRRDATLASAKKKIMQHVRVAEGRHHAEPTCDNCGLMSLRTFRDGTLHRHCDILGLYIPDHEMFPSCQLHTWQNRTSCTIARTGVKWEKGGEA